MRSAYFDNLVATLPYRALEWKAPITGYRRPPRADHTALRVTGGIGDLILAMGPAEAMNRVTGDVVVYSKWPEIAALFTDLPCRHQAPLIKTGLDVIVNLNSLCLFQFAENFRGFHNPGLADLFVRNQGFLCRDPWSQIADLHPHLDNLMGRLGPREDLTRYDITFASLGLKSEPFCRPRAVTAPTRVPYVTIHDGFDVNNKKWGTTRATKSWGIAQWRQLITRLRAAHPGLQVVQLGGPTSRRVPGVDIDKVNALSFEESLRWLQHSLCHFDGDSGVMHAAHALGTPVVALFGPTPKEFFGYPDAVNIGPRFCGNCWWLQLDWVARCAMGYETPECMDSISADEVFEAFSARHHKSIEEVMCRIKIKNRNQSGIVSSTCSPNSGTAAVPGD